jgi:hypothetical protein
MPNGCYLFSSGCNRNILFSAVEFGFIVCLAPIFITQSKLVTASVAYFYLCLADVAFAGATHPNVCRHIHFAAPARLFSWLHKPNPLSCFCCTHYAGLILTDQIVSPLMLLLRPRNTCLCCGCAQPILFTCAPVVGAAVSTKPCCALCGTAADKLYDQPKMIWIHCPATSTS